MEILRKPLRVGIIGVGWGSVVQVPALRMVPEFEVAALCSRRSSLGGGWVSL
jgi:predicted dehydrogenase